MRGIAGVLYPDFFQKNERIFPMLDTMKHRGNDVRDVHAFKNLEIGIVGGKLTTNDRKTLFVGLDGSIFNRKEICIQLRKHGYLVECLTDSEVVLRAYEQWGNDCIQLLRGDFALMILDPQKNKLLLARNRIGKKPLYWFQDQNHFVFASELKAILATGLVPQTPALDAMASYLYFGYMPQDMSPIKGVSKLLPAHYLQLNLDGSKSIQQYWSFSNHFEPKSKLEKDKLIHELDDLIRDSVKIRIPEERSIGCFLTGGLGSSSVAHYLSDLVDRERISAFSVGFEGQYNEDVEAAKQVSEKLDIKMQTHSVTMNTLLDDLVKIAWHLDEPLADPNVIAIWDIARIASSQVKTIYTGMGCDEMFAGHTRYVTTQTQEKHVRYQTPLAGLRKMLTPLFNYIYKPIAFQFLKHSRTNPWQFEYLSQKALFTESEIAKASPRLANIFDPETFLHKFHRLSQVKTTLESYLYFDVKTGLPDNYILMVERLTAAFNLDWRAPYLDRNLVEFAASLPEPEFLTEDQTAAYLKKILRESLPATVVERPKTTRTDFLRTWLSGFELRNIFQLLTEGTLVEGGLISESWVHEQIQKLSVSPDAFRHLWAVLMLEIWYRLYINHPVRISAPDLTVKELLTER